LDRPNIKGNIDLFINLYNKGSSEIINAVKGLKPQVHFLLTEETNKPDELRQVFEVEEYSRALCVQKYYPQKFWDYLSCRSKNINTSWWDDCAKGIDYNIIKSCAGSSEAKNLWSDNIKLSSELDIRFGPVYLVNNQEIYSSGKDAPTEEELKKVFKIKK
jgi:hypothetical protein